MNPRNIVVLAVLALSGAAPVFAVQPGGGAPSTYELSQASELQWPADLGIAMTFLPSLHGLWLSGTRNHQPFSVWVSSNPRTSQSTLASVKKEWSATLSGAEKDLGCSPLSASRFRCGRVRDNPREKEFLAESVYWNSASEIVVLQVRSPASVEDARSILSDFKLQPRKEGAR